MLLCALLIFTQTDYAGITAKLDDLAKARDVEALSSYLAPYKGRNPFAPVRTNGPYDTGRFGWHAILLRMAGDSFVVFSTPLTSEDIGELLFKFTPNGRLLYVPEDLTNGERIVSHDFDIRFDIPNKKAIIKDTLEFQISGARYYPPMLRMGPNYSVSKITDGHDKDVPFLQAGGILFFPSLGTNSTLNLSYTGKVDRPQFSGSIGDREILLTNDYWYPMVARNPAPYRLTVTVPKGWIPVGQGEKIAGEATSDGEKATFKMDVPVSYYSFSAAPYGTASAESNGRTYRMWSNDLTKEQMELQNELYPSIIDFFSKTYWPYPFKSWGAVVSRAYGGGALEAYSFATYGGGMPGADPHETAHTWFGGMLDNTYLKSMWNESFAVFSEGFYRRTVPIGDVSERKLAFIETPSTSSAYNVAPVETASPFVGPAANSLGYGKGAFVLQMLEQEIGTDRLLKSMREWYRIHPRERGAEWPDFEAVVNRVVGSDETWFFDQWLRKTGWVDFDVENLSWDKGKISGNILFNSDPYIVHSEVLIRDAGGHDAYVTALLSTSRTDKRQAFSIPCPGKPALVSFDPWRRILRPIRTDESPLQIDEFAGQFRRYTDPKHAEYLRGFGARDALTALPADLNGVFLVGNPDTLAPMKAVCEKAGFKASGDQLTWKGTTIDLRHGAALAVVELGKGKRCLIGLGQTRVRPGSDSYGRARTVLMDDLGRFLRGWTEPKTKGFLTFKVK